MGNGREQLENRQDRIPICSWQLQGLRHGKGLWRFLQLHTLP